MLTRLVHDAHHDITEYTELEEITQLDSQVKGLHDVFLSQIENESHTFEPVSEKGRQIVIKLTVNKFEVVLEVGSEVVDVKEDLLEVFFDYRQDARELDVPQAGHNIVSYCVVLIADQNGELYVKTLHHLCRLSFHLGRLRLAQADLPMRQDSLDKEIKGDQEINDLFVFSLLCW